MRLTVRVTSSDPYTLHLHYEPPPPGHHPGPTVIIRSHAALVWLHSRILEELPNLIVPPLLQFPTAERQRQHVERFLNAVGRRAALLRLKDVRTFFTENAQVSRL